MMLSHDPIGLTIAVVLLILMGLLGARELHRIDSDGDV
jgi:hypothetical protein